MTILFIFNSILLGVGLAMDAFSISIANGLLEPNMKSRRMYCIAGVYAGFQFLMPMIGWICVHTIAERFTAFQALVPWIALALLSWIGGKMLVEGLKSHTSPAPDDALTGASSDNINSEKAEEPSAAAFRLSSQTLLLQGIATSIDALSVGFTIESYNLPSAFVCSVIIAVVTFVICMAGLLFGRRFGEKFADKAQVLGGIILIAIGLEIAFL